MALSQHSLDKTAFSVASLEDADDELEYWLTRTPLERLEAVELIRQALYGYSHPAPRLQRVFAIGWLEAGPDSSSKVPAAANEPGAPLT